ncbi:hypothetical protein ACQ4PT_015305 [Festuca glaucescens]
MKEAAAGLGHLLVFAFLFCVGAFMVTPVITDVTMAALCPGQDQCSLAIYLTGLQQATRPYFYAYYVAKTLTAMVSEGAMMCLSLAYVADKVPEAQRAAAFGVFSGVCTAGFVAGTIAAHFLSVSSTFQVATLSVVAAVVYMRAFVQETDRGASLMRDEEASLLLFAPSSSAEELSPRLPPLRKAPSLSEMVALLTSSSTFTRAAVITFFHSLGETGLQTALLYFLKAQFHYTKNQYANLLLIFGITGSFSQLTMMPLLAPKLGEHKLLVVALLGSCVHGFLYSIAWSFWVPYLAASCVILSILVGPCIRSIVSKKVGPSEQGMVQGCITGISSTASVISPLVFTPLTAWFLSETAPFNFKGFSLACAGFATLVALIMSINMRPAEVQPDNK